MTSAPAERPVRVVLADDTVEIRALLRLALELDGRFEVVGEAGDGEEAVRRADELRPDAVVLDLAMPVMDGLCAIPLLRSAVPNVKILVLSGFDARQMADEALARGAHDYVVKGAAFEEIADRLAALAPDGRQTPAPTTPA